MKEGDLGVLVAPESVRSFRGHAGFVVQAFGGALREGVSPEFEDFLRLRAPGLSDFAGLAGSEARKA
jgi:hypothetical protein